MERCINLKGCSYLKRLDVEGCENGMLESSIGNDEVDCLESLLSGW